MGRDRPLPLIAAVSLAVASMLPVGVADGAQVGYTVGAGMEYTNNVDLEPRNEKSDLMYVVNGGYSYSELSANLDLRAQLAAQYRIHRDEAYDNEFFGAANVGLVWKPYPRLFHWVVEDTYTPTIDPQERLTFANIHHANVLSTGPDAFFHFGPVDTLNVGGRFVDARYEGEDGDNTAAQGYMRWLHRTSARTTLSLNHERQNVTYKDETGEDFNQATSFAGLAFESAHDRFGLNAGYSTIEREGEDPMRGRVGSLVWDRSISGRTTFNLRLVQDFGDVRSDVVRQAAELQEINVVRRRTTTDVYLLREAAARLRWGITPGTARASSVEVFWNDRNYEVDFTSDEQDQGIVIGIVWPFTRLLHGTLSGSYVERDFYGIGRLDEERTGSIGLSYLLTRRTTVGAWVRQRNNDSNVPDEVYKETRIALFISYGIGGRHGE